MELALGKLEKLDLRNIWRDEARDFTPWLAQSENIALLGEAIGLELEVEQHEKAVGPFSADILCRDVADDTWVLIENQLERTDHIHLGQLLTYGAGLDALTIIWVSPRFTDEHRAALDWLNKITDDHFKFFGLEIEVWKIGNSDPAPKFNVVSKPNDWTRTIVGRTLRADVSGTRRIQLEYWTKFKEFLDGSKSKLRATKPLPQNWMNFSIGRTGIHLIANALSWSKENPEGAIRAGLYVQTTNSEDIFAQLFKEKDRIESLIGEPLEWYNPEDTKTRQIRLSKNVNFANEADWQSQHEWLKTKLEKLQSAFIPIVKNLP